MKSRFFLALLVSASFSGVSAQAQANGLVLVRSEHHTHRRELGYYLELAGCTGEQAERVRALSPGDREHYVAESAWYLCVKR